MKRRIRSLYPGGANPSPSAVLNSPKIGAIFSGEFVVLEWFVL